MCFSSSTFPCFINVITLRRGLLKADISGLVNIVACQEKHLPGSPGCACEGKRADSDLPGRYLTRGFRMKHGYLAKLNLPEPFIHEPSGWLCRAVSSESFPIKVSWLDWVSWTLSSHSIVWRRMTVGTQPGRPTSLSFCESIIGKVIVHSILEPYVLWGHKNLLISSWHFGPIILVRRGSPWSNCCGQAAREDPNDSEGVNFQLNGIMDGILCFFCGSFRTSRPDKAGETVQRGNIHRGIIGCDGDRRHSPPLLGFQAFIFWLWEIRCYHLVTDLNHIWHPIEQHPNFSRHCHPGRVISEPPLALPLISWTSCLR